MIALPRVPTASEIQKKAIQKAPLSKPSVGVPASSPYYYGGGGQKPAPPRVVSTGLGGSVVGGGTGGNTGGSVPGGPPVFTPKPFVEPDWNALINSNYILQGAEGQAQPMRDSADLALGQGIKQALYQYGWDPRQNAASFGAAAPYLDQATLDAAAGNQQSALATAARNYTQADAADDARLTARGMLSSGARTEDLRQIGQADAASRSSAYQTLMDSIGRGVTSRGDVETQIAQMLQKARADAANYVGSTYQPPDSGLNDYMTQLAEWLANQGKATSTPTGPPAPPVPSGANPPPVAPKKAPIQKAPLSKGTVGVPASSPYYYGGGGSKPAAPKKKK